MTTIERLRALHDWAWTDPEWGASWSGEPEKRCPSCDVPWPCDVPALLDALAELLAMIPEAYCVLGRFETCGDPFCSEARARRDAILARLDGAS